MRESSEALYTAAAASAVSGGKGLEASGPFYVRILVPR